MHVIMRHVLCECDMLRTCSCFWIVECGGIVLWQGGTAKAKVGNPALDLTLTFSPHSCLQPRVIRLRPHRLQGPVAHRTVNWSLASAYLRPVWIVWRPQRPIDSSMY